MKKINSKLLLPMSIAVFILVGVGGYMIFGKDADKGNNPTKNASESTSQTTTDDKTVATPAAKSTEDQLVFLIEEEKLAHDVYTLMYQKYGAKVFGNILQSESTHQGRVLTLLQARSIADPRSSQVGVFKNQDLQALYDQLITQGNQSATEAYKVGVAIEEKDIADISTQLATATDEDVITALESLRSGSENHLRAFNRQM